jgi:N-acetylglutamate synthase-like GNAT family acetyltransferase
MRVRQATQDDIEYLNDFIEENGLNKDICPCRFIENLTLFERDDANILIGLLWINHQIGISYIHELIVGKEFQKKLVFRDIMRYIYNDMAEHGNIYFVNTVDNNNFDMINFEAKRGSKFIGHKFSFLGNIEKYVSKIK